MAYARAAAVIVLVALLPGLASLSPSRAARAQAAPSTCGTDGCAVTIDARDFPTGNPLANFSYIVNVDNTKSPSDPLALNTESNSPIVRRGDQDRATVNLPDGRYLVSVRSLDHKMWGAYFTLPNDAADNGTLSVRVDLTVQSDEHPLPLGKLKIFVFEDNAWTNGAPDAEEAEPATGTGGLGGFQIGLEEQTGNAVTVDYFNNPLCGGVCLTDADGFKQIDNLGPATYFADVHPPEHCNPDPNAPDRLTTGPGTWAQTTTIDGGLNLMTPVEEGSDGTGAPGEQLWEPPDRRTAYFFGFVCTPMDWPTTGPYSGGTGEIVGQARNWVEWAPYNVGTYDTPVDNPFIALTDAATDLTVFQGRGDENGNFDIQNVPAGTYNMSIWDEQLNYIMRFKPITVAAGQTVDANDTADNGEVGVGVSRWFGWLEGDVYKDLNGNGQFDSGVDLPVSNTDMDQRWRDGSIKEATFTDAAGHYQYPTAEGGALGRWFVNEQGFARFSAYPGASTHNEITDAVTPSCVVEPPATPANPCIPNAQGGGLLVNQKVLEGHRTTVDWGKRDYPAGTPGQIVGITYWATTRNEFDARNQAHEDYEPAIPDVTVLLETPGPDGMPNTDDDVVVNKYVTDHWQQPNASQDPQDPPGNTFTQNCNPITDYNGADITSQFNAKIGPNCLEVPLAGAQTKEGAFDGGYAFADYCPGGYDLAADDGTCTGGTDPVPLVAGNYITHVEMPKDSTDTRACNPANADGFKYVTDPKGSVPGGGNGCLYRIVREEDVNVDLGNKFAPQIPPPTCDGDAHTIEQATLTPRSIFYTGDQATSPSKPLCDKHLVVLQNGQNANADFFMMTNFRNDPNGETAGDTQTGDVQEPGRLVGQVFNDIYFERNPQSPWYGEPRPIGGIPVGIYARVDTVCPDGGTTGCATPNVNAPYDPNNWRLLKTVTTSADGSFEALVPSTETFNCPIPQGPCPGMYLIKVDDPGTVAHPNPTFDPNLLTAITPTEAWPGLSTQLDLPLDPISGTGCDFSVAGPDVEVASTTPELLQVSRPYVLAGDAGTARRITITGDFIGPAGPTGILGGHVDLTDTRTGTVTNLTRANGGVVSWTPGSGSTPDTIVIQVPALNLTTFRPGPRQLTIVGAASNGGQSSVNGITVHVLGSNGAGANLVTYNPPVVPVPPPPPAGTNAHALQDAVDAAAAGSLLVLSPGVYNENVLMWKPLKIQGLGPGGLIGAHELNTRAPEDPRFNVPGSVIDGRFFQQNATDYDARVAAHAPYAVDPGFPAILRGADITAAAKTTSAYAPATLPANLNQREFYNARVDGLGMMTGRGEGAGGVQLQANINNMRITNNILENNGGIFVGGIGLGQPYAHANHNYNVRIANDRVLGNGGLTRSGGIGIFYGSNNYEVASSIFCSNFGVEYGAGISHWGLSPGSSIHDNQIYYNDAVDSGAGIAIQSEVPVGQNCDPNNGGTPATCLGDGSGNVDIDRNLIQSNFSGDDGGGIFLANALTAPMNIRNNMIVDNGAADLGGAITLDDSSNARIVNNTVANNVTTASSENSAIGVPHGAGLTAEANEPLFQATLPASAPHFSNPTALFNNIFWNNDAMTLSQFGPGATLVDAGFIDFEVHGTGNPADTFTPRYSTLTNGNILGADGVQRPVPGGQANRIGEDPLFVTPFVNQLTVSGSRLDPQAAAVTITGQDPPVGLTGDYHLQTVSPAIDRGVRCSNTPVPANLAACTGTAVAAPTGTPGDYDRQFRPQLRSLRVLTPWDLGADEVPGVPLPLPGGAVATAPATARRA